MIRTRKSMLSATIVACLSLQCRSFTVTTLPAAAIQRPITTSTSLNAEGFIRREVFKALRRGAVGVASLATFTRKPQLAVAEENSSTTGRIVELTVSNLDGVPSKTGTIKIQLRPEWAPRGVKRFEDLTQNRFFEDCRLFRVLPGFVAQFGINGNPDVQSIWRSKSIPDDPVKVSNTRGTVVFATAGPNTRTTQIFFNTREQGNGFLDNQGFSPFGQVIEGMDVVDQFYSGYGEGAPTGKGPNQGLIQAKGNDYLQKAFPQLSYISKATFTVAN
jgi:peptidyl-prolyl cis-trans isomerase A (cyclophilin A)